jgi:hypothetical protein
MEYFAASNTCNGFRSLFEEAFEKCERIFILKGSSGCGKSTFMRRVAGRAEQLGFTTDIIRCSSDPDSFDGVIIHGLDIAVADGTSPHVMDVKYPCVRESIINLGEFWDEQKILPHKDEIISLTDKKSVHYKNAYRCLSAIGNTEDIKRKTVLRSVLTEISDESVFSIAEKAFDGVGEEKRLFASAFTSNGIKVLPAFGRVKRLCRVSGYASFYLLNSLYGIARERGVGMNVSLGVPDPNIPDSLYFPATDTLVTLLQNPPCDSFDEEKNISCAKFTSADILSSCRVRLRGLDRIIAELSNEAKTELGIAKETHNKIESIYINAMDFDRLDEYTYSFMRRIFGE